MDAHMIGSHSPVLERLKNSDLFSRVKLFFSKLANDDTGEILLKHADAVDSKVSHRNELLIRLLSTGLGLAASFAFSYFAIKWLVNAMDPTQHQKKEAQKRVKTAVQ